MPIRLTHITPSLPSSPFPTHPRPQAQPQAPSRRHGSQGIQTRRGGAPQAGQEWEENLLLLPGDQKGTLRGGRGLCEEEALGGWKAEGELDLQECCLHPSACLTLWGLCVQGHRPYPGRERGGQGGRDVNV